MRTISRLSLTAAVMGLLAVPAMAQGGASGTGNAAANPSAGKPATTQAATPSGHAGGAGVANPAATNAGKPNGAAAGHATNGTAPAAGQGSPARTN